MAPTANETITNVNDTIKDAAYTYVGLNAIAAEKISDRMSKRFSNLSTDVNERVEVARKDFDGQLKIAKKTAVSTTKDIRAKVDPVAKRIEARLPEQVASALSTGRTETWKFVGATTPAKPAAAKASSTKARKAAPKRKAASKAKA